MAAPRRIGRQPWHSPHRIPPLNWNSVSVYGEKGNILGWSPLIPHPTRPELGYLSLGLRAAKFEDHADLESNLADALNMLPAVVQTDGTYRLVNRGQVILTVTVALNDFTTNEDWDYQYED